MHLSIDVCMPECGHICMSARIQASLYACMDTNKTFHMIIHTYAYRHIHVYIYIHAMDPHVRNSIFSTEFREPMYVRMRLYVCIRIFMHIIP